MELDNVIYIVITIVIFVVSLLGQSKKKKIEKPEEKDEIEYSLNDFEKLLLRKEEFRNAEPIVERPESNEKSLDEGAVAEKSETNIQKHFQPEEKDNDDGFDIKSAIIYSSILERKKFRR